MGIVIDKYKASHTYDRQPSAADNFATDAQTRLVPAEGEQFEIMPLGSLGVVAYVNVGDTYRQNPYTTPGMRWEVGFSEKRVSFYSPDTDLVIGGIAERAGTATMGFYYYNDLRSLSLGSAREEGGPYVSMVFVVQNNSFAQIPVGVRVHGTPVYLHAFATMLAARFIESYKQLSGLVNLNMSDVGGFFGGVDGFSYEYGQQTDYFINAEDNTLRIQKNTPAF